MATRNVLARLLGPDGLPLPGAWIRYTLIPGTYLDDAAGSQYLRKSLTRYADEDGDTVAPLLVNSGGVIATEYLVEDSSEQDPYYATVPAGAGDITLSDARAAYDGPAGASIVGNFVLQGSAIDGPFASSGGLQTLFGAELVVPWPMPLNEIILRCLTAPLGAAWAVVTWHTPFATGIAVSIATTSVASGAKQGSTTGLTLVMAKYDLLQGECTSVGTADTGADGKVTYLGIAA